MYKIGIDCRPLSRKKTGIGYYLWEILNLWGKNEIPYELLLYSHSDFEIPPQLLLSKTKYQKRVFHMHPQVAWLHTVLPAQLLLDKIDVYWGPNYAMPILPFGAPSVLTIHDMVYCILPKSLKLATYLHNRLGIKVYAKKCNHIIADSYNTKNDINRFLEITEEKISVIHLGVSNRFDSDSIDLDDEIINRIGLDDKPFYLTVGTLEPRKNLRRMVQAYNLFLTNYLDCNSIKPKLVIVGNNGWGQVLKDISEEFGENIKYLDYISDLSLNKLYHRAIGFLYLSLYEGFGLPPLEAMRCGTPVIVSEISSLPEVVGECGLYADPYDIEDIAFQISRLWYDQKLRQILSEKGLKRAKKMGWDNTSKKTLDILSNIITKHYKIN